MVGEKYPWWERQFLGKEPWVYYLGLSLYCILFAILVCFHPLVVGGTISAIILTSVLALVLGILILALFGLPIAILYFIIAGLLKLCRKEPDLTAMHTEESKEIKLKRKQHRMKVVEFGLGHDVLNKQKTRAILIMPKKKKNKVQKDTIQDTEDSNNQNTPQEFYGQDNQLQEFDYNEYETSKNVTTDISAMGLRHYNLRR